MTAAPTGVPRAGWSCDSRKPDLKKMLIIFMFGSIMVPSWFYARAIMAAIYAGAIMAAVYARAIIGLGQQQCQVSRPNVCWGHHGGCLCWGRHGGGLCWGHHRLASWSSIYGYAYLDIHARKRHLPSIFLSSSARWRVRSSAARWIRTGPEGAQLRVCVQKHSLLSALSLHSLSTLTLSLSALSLIHSLSV